MPANLRQLTSFRMIAAVWVVAFHYWIDLFGAEPSGLVAKGYLGVEAFFVLSGFILCHVYLGDYGEGRLGYGRFLWARVARIYPTHLFTLIAVGVMGLAAAAMGRPSQHGVLDWRSLPANLTLTHAWGLAPSAAWNHPSWSISAEWAAYLAFPAFAWAAWRLRDRPRLALTGALALLAGAYALFPTLAGFPLTRATIDWGALRIAPPFAYGCALFLAWRAGMTHTRREAHLAALLFATTTIAAAGLGAPDGVTVAAAGGLILALAEMARHGSPVLASRPAVYLGEASFALYMVAIPWRAGLAGVAGRFVPVTEGAAWPPFLAAVLVVGIMVAAVATHQFVERPARLFLRDFGRKSAPCPIEEKPVACDERPRPAG